MVKKVKKTTKKPEAKAGPAIPLGKKSKFELLINPDRDPSLMKEAALANNFKKFYKLLPEQLRPASGAIYNFFRAKHILDSNKTLSESEQSKKYAILIEMSRKKIREQLTEIAYTSDMHRVLVNTPGNTPFWRDVKTNHKIVGPKEKRTKHKKSPYGKRGART